MSDETVISLDEDGGEKLAVYESQGAFFITQAIAGSERKVIITETAEAHQLAGLLIGWAQTQTGGG